MAFTIRLTTDEAIKLQEIQEAISCNTNSKAIKRMIENYLEVGKQLEDARNEIISLENTINNYKNSVRFLKHHEQEVKNIKKDLWKLTQI